MLTALADPILPVFLVMALGFAMGRTGTFSHDAARGMNRFVFFVGLPAIMLLLSANAPLADYDWAALTAYAACELALYAAVTLVARRLPGVETGEALLLGMASVFVNHFFFVLPIVQYLNPAAAFPIEAVVFVDAAVFYNGTVIAMALLTGGSSSLGRLPRLVWANPTLIALALGLAVNAGGLPLPSGLFTLAEFVGASAAPISLFALGVVLAGVATIGVGRPLALVLAVKVVVHPLLLLAAISALGVTAIWQPPLIATAAGPSGAMPFIIALQYGVPTATIARAILVSTLLSLVSLAALSTTLAG